MAAQPEQLNPCRRIPDNQQVVVVACGDLPAVGRKCHSRNFTGMSFECVPSRAGGSVPHHGGLIEAAGDNPASVRGKGSPTDSRSVSGDSASFLTRDGMEDDSGPVGAAKENLPAIRGE